MDTNDIEIRIRTAIDEANMAKTFGELRKSIKDMKGIALTAGEGTDAYNTMTDAIGSTNLKIKELNMTIQDKSGPVLKNMVKAIGDIGSVGFAGFETMTGAMSVFGDQSDETTKKLVKLQGILVLGKGLSELSEAPMKISRGFDILTSTFGKFYQVANNATKSLILSLSEVSFAGIMESIVAFGTAVVTWVTGVALPAIVTFFSTLDVLVAANPLGAIVIAIVAIVAIAAMMIDSFKPLKLIWEGIKAAITAVIGAVKEFLDYLGLTNFAQQDAAKKTIDAKEKEKAAIEDRYKTEIDVAKASGKEVGYLEGQKLDALKKNADEQIATYKALTDAGIELTDDQKKELEAQTKNLNDVIHDQKVLVATNDKASKDRLKRLEKQRVDAMKEGRAKIKAEYALRLSDLKEQADLDITTDGTAGAALMEQRTKIERDKNDALKKLYKEDVDTLKKLIDEKYEIIIGKDQLAVDHSKVVAQSLITEAQAVLDSELTIAQDTKTSLEDKAAAKQKYFDTIKTINSDEVVQERKLADDKLAQFTETQKLYSQDSFEYKKLANEKIKVEQDFNTSKSKVLEANITAAKKYEDKLLENWQKQVKTKDEQLKLDMARVEEESTYEIESLKAKCDSNLITEKEFEVQSQNISNESDKAKQLLIQVNQDKIDAIEKKYDEEHKAKQLLGEKDYEYNLRTKQAVLQKSLADREATLAENQNVELIAAGDDDQKILDINKKYFDLNKSAEDEFLSASAEAVKKSNEEKLKSVVDYSDKALAMTGQYVSSYEALMTQGYQNDIDSLTIKNTTELAAVDAATATKLKGVIVGSQQEADIKNKAMQQENAINLQASKNLRAIRHKQFLEEKAMNLAKGIMDGLSGVMKALGSAPPPYNAVLAAITAGLAAINIAKLASVQEPASSDVSGGSYAGSTSFSATMPASSTTTSTGALPPTFQPATMFGLGQGGFGGGSNGSHSPQRVYVVESDITSAQQKVSVIQSRALVG